VPTLPLSGGKLNTVTATRFCALGLRASLRRRRAAAQTGAMQPLPRSRRLAGPEHFHAQRVHRHAEMVSPQGGAAAARRTWPS